MSITVFITRPEPQCSTLVAKLRREGMNAIACPMMSYRALPCDLPDAAVIDAVVLTSAHAATLLADQAALHPLPVFCIGEATARAAAEAGFRRVWTAEGEGGNLSALIVSKKDGLKLKTVLHLAGEDTAQDIAPAGIAVERRVIYKAELAEALAPAAQDAILSGDADAVLFFSQRAAAQFETLARAAGGDTRVMRAISLSPRIDAGLGALPWRARLSARYPHLESMLDVLRSAGQDDASEGLPAAAVLAAFGGIRPLAQTLGITASTVQGWKKRNLVPASRIDAILKAAIAQGIDPARLSQTEGFMDDKDKKTPGKPAAPTATAGSISEERRRSADRRVRRIAPDEKGYIHAGSYDGPDRRASADRRAYHERQKHRIWHEKMKFVNRTGISLALLFVAIVYAAYFLLAPEIAEMNQQAAVIKEMEMRMAALNAEVGALRAQKKPVSIGNAISNKIGHLETAGAEAVTAINAAAAAAESAAAPAKAVLEDARQDGVESLIRLLSGVQALGRTDSGRIAIDAAAQKLKSAALVSNGDGEGLNAAVDVARRQDPTLGALLGHVDRHDLGAAALLLALNELRADIDREQPFEDDLQLVIAVAGSDPKTLASLRSLAPYAKNGVLSRKGLAREFRGLAGEIVMAKLEGEDASVKARALRRMSEYVRIRKVDGTGDSVDATVARAQIMLDGNDVQGALQELRKLDGAPAQKASGFIAQADAHVAVTQSSGILSHTIMQVLSDAAQKRTLSLHDVVQMLDENLSSLAGVQFPPGP
jgi:uroporphyrinogen-III synthase